MTEEDNTEEHLTEEDFLIRVRPVKTHSGSYSWRSKLLCH